MRKGQQELLAHKGQQAQQGLKALRERRGQQVPQGQTEVMVQLQRLLLALFRLGQQVQVQR